MTRTTLILTSMLFIVFSSYQKSANAQEAPAINMKIVDKFVKWNRDNILVYQCLNKDALPCTVVCNSGGNDYINIGKVVTAYYSTRRSGVNGSVTGYYLVVDVVDSTENQDVWATLQIESSCLFKGMTPKL